MARAQLFAKANFASLDIIHLRQPRRDVHTSSTEADREIMATGMPARTAINTCRSCLRLAQSSRPRIAPPTTTISTRFFSATLARTFDEDTNAADRPRWQYTPPRMVMPIRTRSRPQGEYKVNNDPRKLDRALSSFFGNGRDSIPLSDEVKWLTVTHKSFDHGRRGFNDRLAFLGTDISHRLTLLG